MSRLDPRDSDTDYGLLCAAVHEAGHAVTAVLGGLEFHGARVYRAGDRYRGYIEADVDKDDPNQVNGCLVMTVAGHEAEALWMARYLDWPHRKALRERRSGCADDMEIFRRYRRHPASTLSEPAARRRAHRLLVTHWRRVEHFADRLARSGRLTATGM